MNPNTRVKTFLGFLVVLVTLGILFSTLWPFNPFPRNRVEWLPDSKGLQFSRSGVVLGRQNPACRGEALGDRPATVEILFQPTQIQFVPTIVDFYLDQNPYRFQLRQYGDSLIVSREIKGLRGGLEQAKIDIDHVLRPGEPTWLALSSGPEGTVVYVNGEMKKRYSEFKFTASDFAGQLILGTAPVQSQPWSGEIRAFAVSAGELSADGAREQFREVSRGQGVAPSENGVLASYKFDQQHGNEIHGLGDCAAVLEIPTHFAVPHRPFLCWPWNEFEATRYYLLDILLNIIGFVPFGVALFGYLSSRGAYNSAMSMTVLAGFAFSLSVEIAQAYIPPRMSGLTDVVTNTLGTALGALLFKRLVLPGLDGGRGTVVPPDA